MIENHKNDEKKNIKSRRKIKFDENFKMTVEYANKKSHKYDEDRIVIGNNFYMVIDGATPLEPNERKLTPTEASWFVRFIKKELERKKWQSSNEFYSYKYDSKVYSKLEKISVDIYKEYLKDGDINPNSLPSAGIAWIEKSDEKVNCYYIGDCEILIKSKSGSIVRVYDERLVKLDNEALNIIIEKAKKENISILQATKESKDVLIKNRRLMNKKNGYPIYTISNNPSFEFGFRSFNLDEIEEIYIYTDGISQAFDELKIYKTCEEMFSKSLDLKKEIDDIKAKAFKDPNCDNYPRFKKLDDISIIKLMK